MARDEYQEFARSMMKAPPALEFSQVLARHGDKQGTLSICVDGASYSWPITEKGIHYLIASGIEALMTLRGLTKPE
jgi:hypothetical protein